MQKDRQLPEGVEAGLPVFKSPCQKNELNFAPRWNRERPLCKTALDGCRLPLVTVTVYVVSSSIEKAPLKFEKAPLKCFISPFCQPVNLR